MCINQWAWRGARTWHPCARGRSACDPYLHLHPLCHLRLERLFPGLKHGTSQANALRAERGPNSLVQLSWDHRARFAMHILDLNEKQTGPGWRGYEVTLGLLHWDGERNYWLNARLQADNILLRKITTSRKCCTNERILAMRCPNTISRLDSEHTLSPSSISTFNHHINVEYFPSLWLLVIRTVALTINGFSTSPHMLELLGLWGWDSGPCEKQAVEGPAGTQARQSLSATSPQGESSYSTSPEL